ncbi:MAG: TetR/AcrR family transcriptional regulator [Faecousia sp.]
MEEKMDLRIQKTYLALHNAFTALSEEKRFEDFTVNELCDRAMIRRTTFYKHFADKYEYFAFYLREVSDTFRDRLAPDVTVEELDLYMIHMSRELVRFIQKHDRLVKNGLNSNMLPILLNILLEQVQEDVLRVLRRVHHPGTADIALLEGYAAFLAGGILSTLFTSLKRGSEIDEERFVEIIARFLSSNPGQFS